MILPQDSLAPYCPCLASLSHSHGLAIPGLRPAPSLLAGPDPDLLICIPNLTLDLSPNHGLPWWPGLWADPGWHPQGCCLTACVVPKLNQINTGGYFRATASPRGWSGQSQLAQGGASLAWRGGMMVSPRRLQEPVVGTTCVLPQWGAERQPQTPARIQLLWSCYMSYQGCAGGKEEGWYLDIVKLGGTGNTLRLHNLVL